MTQRLVGGSVSFDHAADSYDATRALPPEIVAKQTEAIQAELRAAGTERLLEVGIGTGRCSRPLMERGVRVTGVDLAPRMIARLREQLGPRHLPPDLLFGDATRLPFRDASFRTVLMVHVLHLVSSWQRALEEVRRVVAPGGVLLHDVTRYPEPNPWTASYTKWNELLTARGHSRRAHPSEEQLHGALGALGGTLKSATYAEGEERNTPRFWLERTRDRVDSWSWDIPDDAFAACLSDYERWLREHYVDLDREYAQPVQYELEVWSFT